jgi:hypothetical protein
VDRAPLRRQFEGKQQAPSLLPTLSFLRDNRPRALERAYVIADVPSWGLPVLIATFLARVAIDSGARRTGPFAVNNAMIELGEIRLQVRVVP